MIEAYRHLIESAYCAGFFDGDCSLESAKKYANDVLKGYEKPFRVVSVFPIPEERPEPEYFDTYVNAKEYSIRNIYYRVEGCLINGEWINVG